MKNTTWIISVIIITGLFAGKSHRFQIIEKNSLNTKIHFSQEDLTFKNVQEFQEIKSKSYSTTTEPGMPQLPTHHFLFEIDPNSNFQVTFDILSSHTEHGINIKPYQPVILGDTMNDASGLIIDQSFYNSTQIYPSENLIVSDPQILRDLQVVSIGLIPFRYNPRDRTLEVFDEVEIKISVESDDQQFQPNRISKSFTSVYQSSILNYNNSREVSETPVILYICGGNSQNSPYLQSLFSWRHQRGFKVNSVPTSITGTSSAAIKNYIQNQYDNPATRPDFVCLVGDVGGSYNIPTFTESNSGYGGEGDHPYSQLSGNDLLSDVFIGRLPVRSLTDIGVVVNKIINYEKGYDLSSNWTEKAALIGDPTSSGISCTITKEFVADIMEEYGMEDVRLKTSGGSWSNWMQNQLNEGVLYFNYRGYYGTSGFNSSNINNANNGFKLPFTTVITCGTGSFSSESVALSEKFMVAGTMSNPKGGIAAIGTATLGTHTLFNNIFDMGIYQGLFPGGCETAGEALVSGKFYLYENYPSNPNNYVSIFTHWNNLMGDPATHLWTDTPKDFVVTHPETLNWGENLISVTVETADGVPVENARITLLKGSDEIFSNSFSDENGFVQIPVDFQTSGEINITVTKRNMVPYIGIITIPFSGPNITINELEFLIIDDGTGNTDGNGNSIINPGETLIVSIPVYNAGTDGISGIDCELSFLSNSVEVISGVDTISYLPGNNHSDTVEFICQISASAEDHQLLDGYLTIITEDLNTWQFYVPLNVVGAHLDIHDISVAGNEGGFLTPGQTDTLWIALENDGSLPANSLTGNLSSQENLITIDEFEATWIGINSEESEYSENPFVISVSENVIYGSVINFTLQLQSDNGYEKQIIFQILAGEQSVNDPLGPDLHGYYIYDSGDTGYDLAPDYNWIEIDPNLGGSGTALSINDNGNTGDSQIINIPFNFRFYGEDYTQLTVCSNGWIAPGSSPMESFRNYTIPGAGGPSPMIAVFWDDLTTNNDGEIYTYYDEAQGIFIIEWSALRTFNHNSLETFQAILYDNMMPPFGDNEIKLQYKDFNNTSDGSYYQAIHGDYCTVGLEDQTATIGLQYTFNNGYAIPAMTLNDESALFITTRQAQSVPTPELTLEQPDFQFELAPDQWDQEVLTISNGGEAGSILYYGFELLPLPFPGGNPDDFGHFWSDSQIDPTIDNTWIDISNNNIAVEFSHNDVSSGPIEIGFDFPFYGEYYSQCIISPNGWIGFGEDNTEWQNGSIPSIDAPRPAIFPFWDDLNPINGGNSPDMEGMVYYQNSGDYFVIWFDHVAHWNGQIQGNYNFQAVLYPSGEIWFNYDALEGTINRATIGIQNGDGTDGIQVVMDDDYVQENLSTFFRQTPDWVELVSSSGMFEGSLYGAESVSITVSVGSNELAMGEYSSVLKLTTNVEQPMVFPINLFVTESISGDGDLNQDNDINVVDIVLLVNIITGEISPDEYQLWAGDLNGDDVLDVLDIVDLVNIILEQ